MSNVNERNLSEAVIDAVISEVDHLYLLEGYIDDSAIKQYARDSYRPEDVFDESDLADWAESNGYVKED